MPDTPPQILIDALMFAEGPRWHQGALWLSDMHAQQVLKISENGDKEIIVELANDQPSGLGWLPNGDLLIVAMTERALLRYDGYELAHYADLSDLASWYCNDMVVDEIGRAYVGNFGFDLHKNATPKNAELICVEPTGAARVVAEGLMFPNGAVITPDGKTLIVAESFAGKLTAFDVAENGDLSQARTWAQLPEGAVPDGICLDAGNGIWCASPTSNECLRITEGGEVTDKIQLERSGIACMIGNGKLYVFNVYKY